jgi:hypothetical protein
VNEPDKVLDALQFYGERENFSGYADADDPDHEPALVHVDQGERARDALDWLGVRCSECDNEREVVLPPGNEPRVIPCPRCQLVAVELSAECRHTAAGSPYRCKDSECVAPGLPGPLSPTARGFVGKAAEMLDAQDWKEAAAVLRAILAATA